MISTSTARKVLVLGSTGSIGTQALELAREHPESIEIVGIAAAGSDPGLIVSQAQEFNLGSQQVAVAREGSRREVGEALGVEILSNAKELIEAKSCDVVLNALVGSRGLEATMATLRGGSVLALANKESLVAGGSFVMESAQPGQIVPVDSEHSAMAQCLRAGRREELERLVLTASGGPFRGLKRSQMLDVTPDQAAKHPTWSMGQMNTLNSATLVNKGLELIEATLLFDVPAQQIDVTVHPQSIVHSMVTFCDGGSIAQASPPSMKLPIAHALAWPQRVGGAQAALDFTTAHTWEFLPLDDRAFPAVELARHVATEGGAFPAVYNAANEQAAEAFLNGRIGFVEIVDIVAAVVAKAEYAASAPRDLDDVLDVERRAREHADRLVDEATR